MIADKEKKELENTILILNKVLSKYKDREDIKNLYERSANLLKKRNLEE